MDENIVVVKLTFPLRIAGGFPQSITNKRKRGKTVQDIEVKKIMYVIMKHTFTGRCAPTPFSINSTNS